MELKSKEWFSLVYLVAFIVHALIFCPCFSQKQSAKQPKKIQGMIKIISDTTQVHIEALVTSQLLMLKIIA